MQRRLNRLHDGIALVLVFEILNLDDDNSGSGRVNDWFIS